jgi:GT2 family glycosyltransferase
MKKVLIAMAVHDTEENGRSEYTKTTLRDTIIPMLIHDGIRVCIIDNNSCIESKKIIEQYSKKWCLNNVFTVIANTENIGTAAAINQAIGLREPGEHVIKIDNDVLIHSKTWALDMAEAAERHPFKIGVLGLKRRDLEQRPGHPTGFFNSTLNMLPHKPGEKWFVFEQTEDVMGTCTLLPWWLLDKVGYMRQPGVYGYDDVDMCIRSTLTGHANGFLCGIDIEHLDEGGTDYTEWKKKEAARMGEEFQRLKDGYVSGAIPTYYDGKKV